MKFYDLCNGDDCSGCVQIFYCPKNKRCLRMWENFTESEMACKGTGYCEMDDGFMKKMDQVRFLYGKPMIVTSGFRSQSHNEAVGGAERSPHLEGRAADIAASGAEAYRLIKLAQEVGMTGIGLGKNFVHMDDCEDSPGRNRPTVWGY